MIHVCLTLDKSPIHVVIFTREGQNGPDLA